jgi:IclR family transcriptional regulator, acetate operon repressor
MGRDGLSVIEKAAAIIERFLEERATSLSFNEILSGTQLSRATVHRLLSEMTEHALLAQAAQRDEYRLGPLLVSAGALAQQLDSPAARALPRMELLRDQFGETILLAEFQSNAVVPVHRLDGRHEMRMTQEVGRRYPAYAGATGKVLLAWLDAVALTAYLGNVRPEPLTSATVTSVEALRLDLGRIRRIGAAVSRGERVAGSIAVSAPVFDAHGRCAAALTISGVASRWCRDRMFIAGQAVGAAAEAVSMELGYRAVPAGPRAADLKDPASEPYRLLSGMCDELW